MKHILIVLTIISYFILVNTQLSKDNLNFTHWDNLLRKLVHPGSKNGISLNLFNYSGIIDNTDYENFTYEVETADVSGFSEPQWQAFWINVYNYLAIRMVFIHHCSVDMAGPCSPLTSIREIGEHQPSLLKNTVWKLPQLKIASLYKGQLLSLDDILNMLRNPPPPWKEDPRLFACIVCASVSCPDLQPYAYTWQNIEQQLTDSTVQFLKNPKKGSVVESNSLTISNIFHSFSEDFNNQTGTKFNRTKSLSLQWFLSIYGPPEIQNFFTLNNPAINYFTYDWSLNGQVDDLCVDNRLCFPWWAFVCLILGLLILITVVVVIVKRSTEGQLLDPGENSLLEDVYYDDE